MVTNARSVRAPGFGLAEVLVAIVVLVVGVMGAMAAATLAVRTLRVAADREWAVYVAGTVLDSLLQAGAPVAGAQEFPRHRVTWTVRAEGRARSIVLDVECLDSSEACSLRFEALHAAPLPRIGGEP